MPNYIIFLMKTKKVKIFFFLLCLFQLFYLFHSRSNFQYEIIKNPFKENSGTVYSLSSKVIELNSILKKQKGTNFNLSYELKKDNYLYQRSIEFNYPIRINENSKLIFFNLNEQVSNNCKIIESGKYLKLGLC